MLRLVYGVALKWETGGCVVHWGEGKLSSSSTGDIVLLRKACTLSLTETQSVQSGICGWTVTAHTRGLSGGPSSQGYCNVYGTVCSPIPSAVCHVGGGLQTVPQPVVDRKVNTRDMRFMYIVSSDLDQ